MAFQVILLLRIHRKPRSDCRMKNPKTLFLIPAPLFIHKISLICALLFCPAIIFAQQVEGQFWRTYWYQRGAEFANPGVAPKLHVNSPDAVLNAQYSKRPEARENGMMLIPINEALTQIERVELYLEIIGADPGTLNKRLTINGRSTYQLPEVGTATNNFTHQYSTIYLQPTDLVNGFNAIQFACDRGKNGYGHFVVSEAALRVQLRRNHADLQKAGLMGFNALIKAEAVKNKPETIRLKLFCSDESLVSSVEYQGFYFGYDENGDASTYGWHGMTKNKQPEAILGIGTTDQFAVDWNTAMLPDQQEMGVRATIHFKDQSDLTFVTPVIGGLFTQRPKGVHVTFSQARELPAPFAANGSQKKSCFIDVGDDPNLIEQAELQLVFRDSDTAALENYLKINGQRIAIAGAGKREIIYRKILIDPKILKRGVNQIELEPQSEHHGIEILLPGPALMIRSK